MGIVDSIRILATTVRKYKDPDLLEQVINLQTNVLELQDRVRVLEEENALLRKRVTIQGTLVINDGVYFEDTPSGNFLGPYCTRCWDVTSKLVRLMVLEDGYATCPECKNTFDYKYRGDPGGNYD